MSTAPYTAPYIDEQGCIVRQDPLHVAEIRREDIIRLDLSTVASGDWMEGVGDLKDFAIIGFLHQLARARIQLVPKGTYTRFQP